MKTYREYLQETARLFRYRIKILGDVSKEFEQEFRRGLLRFDPESISDVKTTPVMSHPTGFPQATNQRVSMIDVAFRYPATDAQIRQVARLQGLDEDRILMNQLDWQLGMDQELLGIEQQRDLLIDTDFPQPNPEQKQLSRDYAAVGVDKAVVKNSAAEATWTVAGGRTPPAETTNDLPMGVKSPMTTVKRPPRPTTGFRTQGR